MKKSKKILFGALTTASATLVVTPIITSCSNSSDINKVDRGNGESFAKYKFNGVDQSLSFEEVLAQSAASKDGFAAFKQQIAKELIYNWYQGVKDSGKNAPQSFKDNWSTWTDAAKKAYDDKVQSYKDSHKKTWEYYFQNEVLDPVGGTKDAFIRQQMYDKVYDAFKNLVFTNNYLAYTTDQSPNVNSEVNSFTESTFNDAKTWKNIGFYAKANTSYRVDSQDLDDVYAILQSKAFDAYTLAKHPQALLMALWKYAAPSEGMYTIYSKNIPATDEEKKSNSSNEETTKTLKAKYETPGFPKYDAGGDLTANGKFKNLVTDFFKEPTYKGANSSFNIDENGMFRYINQGSTYQDDSSTMGFVLNMNEMYSKLDAWFCPAVTQLYESAMLIAEDKSPVDNFLDYPVSLLINNGVQGSTDILNNFFFRSNDKRVFGTNNTLTDFGNRLAVLSDNGTVLDLSKTFAHDGEDFGTLENGGGTSDFHSTIFLNSPSAQGNYYGYNNEEGGVQWAVNALWLTDNYGNRLPYVLFRDTNGVHLCGLYGAFNYKTKPTQESATPDKGFLALEASADNDNTEPFSQGRQNIMLKALNLYMKTRNESLFDLSSEVKTYFTSNVDDIVINMALDGTKRGNSQGDIIFDLTKVLDDGVTKDAFKQVLENSTIYFLLQSTLTSYLEANKKLYGLMSTFISNSVLARSTDTSIKGKTSTNYKNGVATPMPYIGEYKDSSALPSAPGVNDADLYTGYLTFPIANPSIWVNVVSDNEKPEKPVLLTTTKDDVWATSFTRSTVNATTFLEKGTQEIIDAYKAIISTLNMTTAALPFSEYANWSEHLNPKYVYNENNATNAIGNGLYMAINKFLSGTQETNRIKLSAYKAYATKDKDRSIFEVDPDITNLELGVIKNTGTKFSGLRDAVSSMMYSKKVFTSDTPLTFYTEIADTQTQESYRNLIERLGKLSIAHSATASSASDDLISYWTFIDTLQYLVNNDYEKLMSYLQTSVMSYGVEADLVWVAQDTKEANPGFMVDSDDINDEAAKFGWQANYYGKYSHTYLPTDKSTTDYNTVSSFIENSAYYQSAPLKYKNDTTEGAINSIMGMGFAGLATSSNTPSVITTPLQNALFTDTYKSKTNEDKTKHYGGWYKYGNETELYAYIKTLASVADIQKMATNLGAANEDAPFTTNVVDVVKRTTFQDGDPEVVAKLKLNGKEVVSGQALTPEVLRARLLGGKQTIENQTIDYTTVNWGLEGYKTIAGEDTIKDLFTRFGGEDGVAKELYATDADRHAMRVTSDSTGANNYAKMMVIQLNNADFREHGNKGEADYRTAVQNLNYALTGNKDDYTLLNYIAVQYAQQSSLQTQATNDVVKTILGDDNKVVVYDRRFNDKLGPTWVKDYKATN